MFNTQPPSIQIDFSWLDALSIAELEAQLQPETNIDLSHRLPSLKTLQEALAVQSQRHQSLLQELQTKTAQNATALARVNEAKERIAALEQANDEATREFLEANEEASIKSISKCLAQHLEKTQALCSALEAAFKQQNGLLSLQEFCRRFRAARMVARQVECKLKSLKELQTLGYTQIPTASK